jgi:hypothetical protein
MHRLYALFLVPCLLAAPFHLIALQQHDKEPPLGAHKAASNSVGKAALDFTNECSLSALLKKYFTGWNTNGILVFVLSNR